jgi:hypothetical protein
MVHHAAQARQLGAALLCAATALVASGCGVADGTPAGNTTGTHTSTPTTVAVSGNPTLGNVRLADCAAWRRGDPIARRGTIKQIAAFAGGSVGAPGGTGATLPAGVAYRYFDAYCKNGFATYFKLYKLYTRAAGFGVND